MRLRSLGGLALEGAELSRPKPLLLLTFLALEGPQQRRHLAELFWPRAAQRMRNLRVALTQLRNGAPAAIEADGAVLAARVGSDATELRAAYETDPLRAARLYQGRFLDGFDPEHVDAELEEWVYATRERLAGYARRALLELALGEAGAERFEAAARWAEAAYDLPGAAPLEGREAERLYGVLVAGESPRTAEVRRELEELGVPVERTVDRARSELRSASDRAVPSNLPARVQELVGRAHEIERIGELLDGEPSLLSLVGPPGIGKTSLASAVAHGCRQRRSFPDGVFVVWLAPVADAALVPATIAQAVGVPEDPLRPALETLQHHLRASRLLLVLDNMEHVADAASDVAALLTACPGVKVLATSRVALRVGAEVAYAVPPLALPASGADARAATNPAVELFVRRARSADASFRVDDGAARAVAAICRRLEGLPLAIELAAARIRMFPPEALLARLDQRLDVLKGGARDRPERHRTLRQAIAWSYQLLGGAEQALFRRLSAFAGGFSLASAEALADAAGGSGVDALDGVAALIDASLLQHVRSHDSRPRYAMLDSLRAFGLERLEAEGELHQVRRAHAEHFVALAERAAIQLTGKEQAEWLAALEAEHDDLRLAFAWAAQTEPAGLGLRLAAALWRFWIVRGHMHEGRERIEGLLRHLPAQRASAARARVLIGLGTILHELADMTGAERRLRESLSIHRQIGDRPGELSVLNNLSWMAVLAGDFPVAWSLGEEALDLAQRLQDRRGEALALNNMGWTAAYRGDLARAQTLYRRSLELRYEEGDRRGAAYALVNLASLETECGRLEGAGELLERALAILRELGDRQLTAWAILHQGALKRAEGRSREAVAMLDGCMAAWREVGNPTGLAIAIYTLAGALCELGRLDEAERLLREDVPLWRVGAGAQRNPWCAAQREWGLARIARARGDADRARQHLATALDTFRSIGARRAAAACTTELADIRGGAAPQR